MKFTTALTTKAKEHPMSNDMKRGDIAVIMETPNTDKVYIGTVVIRDSSGLMVIGGHASGQMLVNNYIVKLLSVGDSITITRQE